MQVSYWWLFFQALWDYLECVELLRISVKLIGGFLGMLALSVVIGAVGLFQIMEVNTHLEDIADEHAAAMDCIDSMMFEGDYMLHMMHHYLEGTTASDADVTTRDKFILHADLLDEEAADLLEIQPNYQSEYDQIDDYHENIQSLCTETGTGLFDTLDAIWAISDQIHADYSSWLSDIDTLIAGESDPAMVANASALKFQLDYQTHMMHHYLEGTGTGPTGATRVKFADAGTTFDSSITQLLSGSSNPTLVTTISVSHAAYEALLEASSTGLFDLYDDRTAISDAIHVDFPLMLGVLSQMEEKETAAIDNARIQATAAVESATLMIFAAIVLSMVVGCGTGFLVIRAIVVPVNDLKIGAEQLAGGDLTLDLTTIRTGGDELGILGNAFREMVGNLRDVIRATQDSSMKVASTSEELASTAEEINASTEEVSATVEHIARGAGQQAEMAMKAIDNVSQMSSTVDESLRDIEGTSGVIQDIAGQTNMLALNAAIEAARAGEYGRGFGVVADNVRVLAENSRSSANQINTITSTIVSNIGGSVSTISESVQSIASVAEEFSASAEEVSSAVEEMSASMEEMSSNSQELANLSEQLSAVVGRFKL